MKEIKVRVDYTIAISKLNHCEPDFSSSFRQYHYA